MPGVLLVVLEEGDEVWTVGWARFEKVVCNDEATDCKELNCDCADASSADSISEDENLAVVATAVMVDVQKSKNCANSGSR